ncbi:hypothetical protein HN873_040869, partial [Arachis hypogaea]
GLSRTYRREDNELVRSSSDRSWTIVGVGSSSRVSSSRILGKRIKLALGNNLIHYLPSTL